MRVDSKVACIHPTFRRRANCAGRCLGHSAVVVHAPLEDPLGLLAAETAHEVRGPDRDHDAEAELQVVRHPAPWVGRTRPKCFVLLSGATSS